MPVDMETGMISFKHVCEEMSNETRKMTENLTFIPSYQKNHKVEHCRILSNSTQGVVLVFPMCIEKANIPANPNVEEQCSSGVVLVRAIRENCMSRVEASHFPAWT